MDQVIVKMPASNRQSWTKAVHGLNTQADGGYAFIGEFLKRSPYENRLPEGAVLVQRTYAPGGGVTWRLGRVSAAVDDAVHWEAAVPHREFLKFRQEVAVALGETAPSYDGWSSEDAAVEDEIALADLIAARFRRLQVDAPAGAERDIARGVLEHLTRSGQMTLVA